VSVEAEDYTYSYRNQSTLDLTDGVDLRLATSTGAAHPHFFHGFVERADVIAAALLVVARVARTRFYTPPGMLAAILAAADPIVTSNGDRLRFESLSACCGVYCRLDLLPEGLDRPPHDTGTTNVDFNPPMRDALAGVRGLEPMHLAVGDDEVRVTTLDGSAVERRVPLPPRWIKGLAEVQLASTAMTERASVSAVDVRRLLQSLPRTSQRGALHVVRSRSGLRVAAQATPESVPVAGLERLRVLEPMLRHASGVRAYAHSDRGADADTGSGWQIDLPGSRLTVLLSPSLSRGFSGEGGVLYDLADATAAADADLVSALLAFDPRIDIDRLADGAGLPPDRTRRALTHLAAAGRVGYDLAERSYFHRELPFQPGTQARRQARLDDARTLVDNGFVSTQDNVSRVRSGDTVHVVRHTVHSDRCTCTWFASHGLNRGPCKHILAAQIHRQASS
jgi:hypothetical protein